MNAPSPIKRHLVPSRRCGPSARILVTIDGTRRMPIDAMTDVSTEDVGGHLWICDDHIELMDSGGVTCFVGSIGDLIGRVEELRSIRQMLARAVESEKVEGGA